MENPPPLNIIIWFVRLILPSGETMEQLYSWARRFSVVFLLLCAALGFLLAAGDDLIPGVDGFAKESEVSKIASTIKPLNAKIGAVSGTLKFLQIQSIEQAIDGKIKLRCLSTSGENREDLSRDIQRLEDRYYALSNQGYAQPNCYEVGVADKP